MGIMEKHAYRFGFLKSEEWQYVRAAVLAESDGNCYICGKFGLKNDVHHIKYPPNVWDTKPSDCVLLCRKCHKKIHIILKTGFVVNEEVMHRIRSYVKQKDSEKQHNKRNKSLKRLAKKLKLPRCIACRRADLPLQTQSSMENAPTHVMSANWLWCQKCWDNRPQQNPLKIKLLRDFFNIQRVQAVKDLFDNAEDQCN